MQLEPRDDDDRIRVSDREREHIIELLGTATGEGRLTLDEYEDRVTLAHAARTRGELARLTHDLPVTATGPAVVQPTSLSPVEPVEKLTAVFGEETRKGRWRVPGLLRTLSVFGSCRVDLHEAELQQPVTVIEATTVFGDLTVVVPEGTDVRLTGSAIFGSKTSKMREPVRPGAPVVEVRTRVVFGEVTVRPPRKPWLKQLLNDIS
ncbi:DUF1707 domain-containing protein [Micromonospora polyrhachis]|uniref:Cell wall-active antibiotics response 4TMS YvqF n=1 Tax=Micromonospora polyrhachis TaxID=1282883 RepID=A0A7W7WMM1_9ACTN|nr:DUF1707 domain-containing protein [Micromonospora polyrhachis]MBB4956747.1 hypothetical protein [Micromonospora polyrhachis]